MNETPARTEEARRVGEAEVIDVLRSVRDPEIPNVSIVDLGMIGAVTVDGRTGSDGGIRVELLPTFVGCPALEVIRSSVEEALGVFDRPITVDVSFSTPWSSERITTLGREQLRLSGFAPPTSPDSVACPHCGSSRVAMDGLFGPTQCRSLYYCRDCRQPFEAFKEI